MTKSLPASTNRVRPTALLSTIARLRGIGMASMLLGFILFGVANLSAYPVVFSVQGTAGAVISCSNPSVCDPLDLSGGVSSGTYVSGITATGAADTTCDITFTGGGGTGATATVALSGVNTLTKGTNLVILTHGSNYTSAPTTGTVSNGTATCTGIPVLTSAIEAPATFTLSGSFDTSATPISSGVGCSAGTNCNTYNVASVTVISSLLVGTTVTVDNVPITITVNSSGNPDTFYTSLPVPSLVGTITVTALAGIKNGTISSPTPDGFGNVAFVAGSAPYTFGSTISYVGTKGNLTELSFSGSIDAVNVLHSFSGRGAGGGFPRSGLTQTALKSGISTFYGTTYGSSSLTSTLFGLNNNPANVDTLLSSFAFVPTTQGTSSEGIMLQASSGLLYGVNTTSGPDSSGAVFYLTPGTTALTIVDPSTANPTALPAPSSLIEATDGNIYGVTTSPTSTNYFFQIVPPGNLSGSVHILYTFTASNGIPSGPVIQATDGNFYGETTGGATSFGQVYRITKTATPPYSFASVYPFTNGADGENPSGGLIQGGLLYGVSQGGANGRGVIFSLNLGGTTHTFVPFSSAAGETPSGGMIAASNNLYGITSAGGTNGLGTVFEFNLTSDTISTVHSFSGPDGSQPQVLGPSLTQASDGRLYGTASADGSAGFGTVYSLDLSRLGVTKPKPVITGFTPASGAVGSSVRITGKNLLGVGIVTFNGTTATFTSKGANYIVATVPTGATTGPIAVTTPNGVVTSTTNFTVP